MRTLTFPIALLMSIAGCVSASAPVRESLPASVASPAMAAAEHIAPLADHHQHLYSSRVVEALDPLPLPAVELPPDLAALLRKRVEHWRDPDALKELFTSDAIALSTRFPNWVTGAEQSAWGVGWIGGPLFRAYSLTPVSYRLRGSVASIAGYYMDAEGSNDRPLGLFHIDVERGPHGAWRIASEIPVFPTRQRMRLLSADELIAHLDSAGIRRAVVLSSAYLFDGLAPLPGDEYANVRAENDWAAEQVQRYPGRLVAFCSFNPRRDHALAELERCANNPAFRGVKLHLGTSPVDLDNPTHVARTRRVFAAANRLRLPLLVHLAASPEWGARQAEVFLTQLAAAAPDVQVVVAHLWGGAGYAESALAYLAQAVASGHPAAKNLYFEVSQAPLLAQRRPEILEAIARHMRTIGLERIYYGSDSPRPPGVTPKEHWERFRTEVPLTDEELGIIANNVAPWAR